MTSEFTHYTGCRGDMQNCSACALMRAGIEGPNYAAWPLAYMQNGRKIPLLYYPRLVQELDRSDNVPYVENLKNHLKAHGYEIDIIRRIAQEVLDAQPK